MKASIRLRNSAGPEKDAPPNALREKILNQISTWFSQLADVGVK